MKPLQSHSKLTEIQTRLNKESYLSRSNLPGSADARMFMYLDSIKSNLFHNCEGYPDRKLYPNFYHWYVLMKQFSLNSIQKWLSSCENIEDDIIGDLTSIRLSERQSFDILNLKKPQAEHPTQQHSTSTKLIKSEDYTNVQCHEIEYVMDVKLKDQIQCSIRELFMGELALEEIQSLDIQEFIEDKRVRIVAKMEPEKFQQLKNKISALEGVETFESKKKDKRFKTAISGEL